MCRILGCKLLLLLGLMSLFVDGCNRRDKDMPFRNAAYQDFDRTIRRLNDSLGLCIK